MSVRPTSAARLTLLWSLSLLLPALRAQEASVHSAVRPTGEGAITFEAKGLLPKPAPVYTATARAEATVSPTQVSQTVRLDLRVLQGLPEILSFGLRGSGEVRSVNGERLESWSVRRQGEDRFLDLKLKPAAPILPDPLPAQANSGAPLPQGQEFVGVAAPPPPDSSRDAKAPVPAAAPGQAASFTIEILASHLKLPSLHELAHLTAGTAAGFVSQVSLRFNPETEGRLQDSTGFLSLPAQPGEPLLFHLTTGGRIALQLSRQGGFPPPVELTGASLSGVLREDQNSVSFVLRGTAEVRQAGASLTLLRGQASLSAPLTVTAPAGPRLLLTQEDGRLTHQLSFLQPGSYPVQLEIAAALVTDAEWKGVDFEILPGTALLPITLSGLPAGVEFRPGGPLATASATAASSSPLSGHLPPSGQCKLAWKPKRQAATGKLFFTSTAFVETSISTGAIRQEHFIELAVLQGELAKLDLAIEGNGDILAVETPGLLAWNAAPPAAKGAPRLLSLTLSRPVKGSVAVQVRTQSPLAALPASVQGSRVTPTGTLRHSGHLRVSNQGSVSLQPSATAGLIQLAPEQLPVKRPLEARQIFVYRFPSAAYSFEFAAAQVQPEISVSQQTIYRLGEADRTIHADLELDIREAPIRETSFLIPAGFSVVSLTGAGVQDYVVSSEPAEGRRGVKVIYGADVTGRQLLQLALEKTQPAEAGSWTLAPLSFPSAKSVRGDIGAAAAPGYRLSVEAISQLVEKPLASFPSASPDLQQAFRIREPDWSAALMVEALPRNVQADAFHLFTLRDHTAFVSVLLNYFVTGAPVSEWEVQLPQDIANVANVAVDGRDIRTWRVEQQRLMATLQQPVMGPYTLLVTYERKLPPAGGVIRPGEVIPLGVAGESGYLQVVSPVQIRAGITQASPALLRLDPLELPAEFQLLSSTPSHATYQYTARPFTLELAVDWYNPGSTIPQVIEFAEVSSRVSNDGEIVSDLTYFVKSRGQHNLRLRLPGQTRLWSASVDHQSVSALRDGEDTLIPLPGGADLNAPCEVRIRLGAAAQDPVHARLILPPVSAPVLKTEWIVQGDEGKLLLPAGGTVRPAQLPRASSGFTWIGRHALGHSFTVLLLAALGLALARRRREVRLAGVILTLGASLYASRLANWAIQDLPQASSGLRYSLPSLPPGEAIFVQVNNLPPYASHLTPLGVAVAVLGLALTLAAGLFQDRRRRLLRTSGIALSLLGLLAQPRGAAWFYYFTALALILLILPAVSRSIRHMAKSLREARQKRRERRRPVSPAGSGPAAALLLFSAILLSSPEKSPASPAAPPPLPPGFTSLDSVEQTVQLSDDSLSSQVTVRLTGRLGDRFLLLSAPATLTGFQGTGLRLAKASPGQGETAYVLHPQSPSLQTFSASFSYRMDLDREKTGFRLPTGLAATQKVSLSFPKPGWRFSSPAQTAIQSAPASPSSSGATLILAPLAYPQIERKLQERDPSKEDTRFYVEAEQLYTVSPGVVDGRHALEIRPYQGQVTSLKLALPPGLTASEVSGPVDSWQFDAATRVLQVSLAAPQTSPFLLKLETQASLDPLPAETSLAPILVPESAGQSGLLALACGPDAQLESIRSGKLATVPISDFAGALLPLSGAAPQQVHRYDQQGGSVSVRAVPTAPQIRATTQELLSLGEERLVLSITAEVEISRAGVFQLRFPLPAGLEVESLTGPALHHWTELEQDGQTWILLHLQGKTLGTQTFTVALAGASPPPSAAWLLPRLTFADVSRQTGQIVVRPAPGLRLRAVSRRNVSEVDARSLGGQARDALAFRLLQADWEVQLGIEQLDPWITGRALHELTLREGQTRSTIHCQFQVENASVRALRFRLPGPAGSPEARKTVRATGKNVSGLLQPDPADNALWEVQFKRRILGEADFRIEFEQRQDRENGAEAVTPAQFPDLRQLAYFHALRGGGRLDLSLPAELPQGWQLTDWSSVPDSLRAAGSHASPALTLRAMDVSTPLPLQLQRHSLAEALKLRVSRGTLTTVLSPLGDELTAVDLQLDVVQRSSLTVALPAGATLFNIFVNGESVRAVQQNGSFQFYVLPGADDRTAAVRFVFAMAGGDPYRMQLASPRLNVPLENMEWHVLLPQGFTLARHSGNLELKRRESREASFTKQSYLQASEGKRAALARQAEELLEQANDFIQKGEQQKARRALSSVTNQAGLDAASNEDARVQLENLQTQQAVVGLNTRRQRLYLDNGSSQLFGSEQVDAAITNNRVLNEGDINFKPQDISQLLQGNTSEDNTVLQRIAARLVQHQKSTDPAPPAITTTLPEEGTAYTFRRTVQVNENAPLDLHLRLASTQTIPLARAFLLLFLLLALGGAIYLLLLPTRVSPPPGSP